MSLEEAAALPAQWLTAWHALTELCRVRRGETVLIHAAAGGVGTAAVQLCRELGLVSIGTASTAEKIAYAKGQGLQHGIVASEVDWVAAVKEITGCRGVDVALDAVSAAVEDWSGGTRIGTALHAFNRTWARRVLGQGAVVLLITDGLDRDAGEGLAVEAERLHKSCRRLVWLNPLLRWEGFAPRSSGIRALLPHVDDFRPVHNLNSLAGLADALNREGPRRADGLREWLRKAA